MVYYRIIDNNVFFRPETVTPCTIFVFIPKTNKFFPNTQLISGVTEVNGSPNKFVLGYKFGLDNIKTTITLLIYSFIRLTLVFASQDVGAPRAKQCHLLFNLAYKKQEVLVPNFNFPTLWKLVELAIVY